MERRREFRYQSNQLARIVVLVEPEQTIMGQIQNLSGRGMQVLADVCPQPGSPVRVEWDDLLTLGEVTYSSATAEGGFQFGIHLDQALTNLEELHNLWTALADAPQPVAALR